MDAAYTSHTQRPFPFRALNEILFAVNNDDDLILERRTKKKEEE